MTYKAKELKSFMASCPPISFVIPLSKRRNSENYLWNKLTYLKDPVKTVKEQAVSKKTLITGHSCSSKLNSRKWPAKPGEQRSCERASDRVYVMTFTQSASLIWTISFPVKRYVLYAEFFAGFSNIRRYFEYHLPGFLRYLYVSHCECLVLSTNFFFCKRAQKKDVVGRHVVFFWILHRLARSGGWGGYSLIWAIRGRAYGITSRETLTRLWAVSFFS